jgi:hypothetical protein
MKDELKSAMVMPRDRVQRRINFAKVFPQIKTAKVEVRQRNHKFDAQAKYFAYDETTLTEYVDCLNPMCAKGALHIARILRDVVDSKSIDYKVSTNCGSHEMLQIGRSVKPACGTQFQVAIHIEYKEHSNRR